MYKSLFVYILKYTYYFHFSSTVSNLAAGEGWNRSVGSIVGEIKYCAESRRREIKYCAESRSREIKYCAESRSREIKYCAESRRREIKYCAESRSIGHILCRNCILKQVIEGKIERNIEVIGRQGRRRKQPLGDIRETSGYWKLKNGALNHSVCRQLLLEGVMDLSQDSGINR
jgi:hypothetical protein